MIQYQPLHPTGGLLMLYHNQMHVIAQHIHQAYQTQTDHLIFPAMPQSQETPTIAQVMDKSNTPATAPDEQQLSPDDHKLGKTFTVKLHFDCKH